MSHQPNFLALKRNDPLAKDEIPESNFDEEDEVVRTKRFDAGQYDGQPPLRRELLATKGSGHPLSADERNFFEPRFGKDFSPVRVHAGPQAAAMAKTISAQAFTWGRDIYFGERQYRPGTREGRFLMAHELTHTLQQSTSLSSRPRRIQRTVSPQINDIREALHTSFISFDWWITDEEAHQVLTILDPLNDTDLRDTVAVMEQEGLIDDLFSNVSEDDQANYENLLQRIQNNRVHVDEHGVRSVHSCSPGQLDEITSKISTTQDWARDSKQAVADFIANPAGHPETATALDRHFFHQANTRNLSEQEQQDHARRIRDNFQDVEQQNNPFTHVCASPFDSLCSGFGAFTSQVPRTVTFCPSFFGRSDLYQTALLFHELTHAYADVRDRAYGFERLYQYLEPVDAMNNADSYELFARDIVAGGGGSASQMRAWRDSIDDCTDEQTSILQNRFAYGARMVRNALNVIQDSDISSNGGAAEPMVITHFKTSSRSDLRPVIENFRELREDIDRSINFECEDECDAGEYGYYYRLGWTTHVCPEFFNLQGEDEQVDRLLTFVAGERLGISEGVRPGEQGYAAQTTEEATDNPSAYAGYARDVTNSWWQNMQASSRYRRGVLAAFDRRRDTLLRQITAVDGYRGQIENRFVRPIRQAMNTEMANTPLLNADMAQTVQDRFIERLENLMALAEQTSRRLSSFNIDLAMVELNLTPDLQDVFDDLRDHFTNEFHAELFGLIAPLATRINNGETITRTTWPDLDALASQYDNVHQVIRSYLPLYQRTQEVFREIYSFSARLIARYPARRSIIRDETFHQAVGMRGQIRPLQTEIKNRIMQGQPYTSSSGLANPDSFLRRAQRAIRRVAVPRTR